MSETWTCPECGHIVIGVCGICAQWVGAKKELSRRIIEKVLKPLVEALEIAAEDTECEYGSGCVPGWRDLIAAARKEMEK